jgi:septum site-determining protein MinC
MSTSAASAFDHPPLVLRTSEAVPTLVLQRDLVFEELREQLRFRLPDHLADLPERTLRLDLQHREIKLFDLRRLINFLREEFTIDVSGLYARSTAVHRFAERELKLRLFIHDAVSSPLEAANTVPTDSPAPEAPAAGDERSAEESIEPAVLQTSSEEGATAAEEAAPDEATDPESNGDAVSGFAPAAREESVNENGRKTLTLNRTLRSGNSVRYDGDVFLFGDVNPGAHISATGNVVILGALKGMAHAGVNGDETAFILALDLRSFTQLRIARHIATAPERGTDLRSPEPEMARASSTGIAIEPYRGRLR